MIQAILSRIDIKDWFGKHVIMGAFVGMMMGLFLGAFFHNFDYVFQGMILGGGAGFAEATMSHLDRTCLAMMVKSK